MLNIFPEGNRSPDGNLLPFQKGVALILRRANVPVIPAAIHGTYEAWPLTRKLWRISPVRVAFGAPINLDGLTTDEAITASIESEIRRLLAQAQPIPT
jgi:1-acyl-sn-glycerol-3-phosphate acyltransferase